MVGSARRSKSPANARSKSSPSPSGSSVARKPTSPKLIANTGTSDAGELAQAGEDRAVAAEHDAEVDVGVVALDELDPLAALDAVLAGLLGVEHERRAGAPRGGRQLAEGVADAVAAPVGHDDGLHASTSASRASTSTPPRAPSPSHTNVSRLPAGPGSPEEAKPSTAAPSSTRAGGHRADRGPPRLGVAHHAAAAHVLAPGLELRLDHRQRVEALGRARQHGREHLAQRDEADVDHDQVGRVGQLRRLQRPRVDALDHRHPRVLAQRPVELAVGDVERDTCSAPACSRQSVKPPVEAPTSRQRRPAGSTSSASSALRSLIPPRET